LEIVDFGVGAFGDVAELVEERERRTRELDVILRDGAEREAREKECGGGQSVFHGPSWVGAWWRRASSRAPPATRARSGRHRCRDSKLSLPFVQRTGDNNRR